jgi:lysozyme family protein
MKLCLTVVLVFIALTLNKDEKYECKLIKPKADFRTAYQQIRRWEGNYTNTPGDYGLATYGGITKRFSPNWYGWRYVDAKARRQNELVPEAEMWVQDFYLTIWVREGFYKLSDQEVANYLLDMRIHLYTRQAVKIINETYGTQLKYGVEWIDPTLDTINIESLKITRRRFYLNLIERKPHYNKFKRNWLRRAEYI